MGELKAGEWPVEETKFDVLDPDKLWLPRSVEDEKEENKDWTPQGLTDKSDLTNGSTEYNSDDQFTVKKDDYMDKEPKAKMTAGTKFKQALHESYDEISLGSNSWDREEVTGTPGDTPYTEYTFDADGLNQLADMLGVDVDKLKGLALPTDGFDDEQLEASGLPIGDEEGEGRYEEYVFDADELDSNAFDGDFEDDTARALANADTEKFGVIDGEDYEVMDESNMSDLAYRAEHEPEDLTDDEKEVVEASKEDLNESAMDKSIRRILSEAADGEELLTNVPAEVVIDEVDLKATQDYIPDEDPDLAAEATGLDTFEHARSMDEPRPIDPLQSNPIMESYFQAKRGIKNTNGVVMREAERGFKDMIADYINALEPGDPANYNEFVNLMQDEHGEDVRVPSRTRFNNLAKDLGGSVGRKPSAGKRAPEPAPEKEAMDLGDFGDEFNDIGAIFHKDVDQDILNPDMTVAERYDNIFNAVYSWATSGKSTWEAGTAKEGGFKRHLFLCGNPGIGKSFTVMQAMKAAMRSGLDGFQTQYVRGSIGSAQGDIMAFINKFQRDHLIIFDDCDDFIDNPNNDNVMKGILELDNPHTMTGSMGVKQRAAKMDPMHHPLDFEEGVGSFLTNSLNPLHEELDLDPDGDQGEDIYIPDGEADDADFPDMIEFRSRVLFISNKSRDQVAAAVRDRTTVTELGLTPVEIVDRIGQLVSVFLANETTVTPERLAWGKNNAYKWLKLGVMSDGSPINLPNGAQLKFPSLTGPGIFLTFRNYIELVEQWIKLAATYEAKHPNINLMEASVLPPDFMRMFLVSKMIPSFNDVASGGDKKKKGRR